MSFGFPWGLLALGALVPLVAAYFLRRRQKPVVVSALFLWRTPRPRAEAGPRWERFTREASLLLEALAVIAAALYLADVRLGEAARTKHLVLVVDGSLSMSARGPDGVTVLELARREAAKRVEDEAATRVTVLATGLSPRVVAGPEAEPSRALAALESFQSRGADHDPMPTLLWAQELAGAGKHVAFFTDAAPVEGLVIPAPVRWTALGTARENVAFVSAQRKDDGGTATVTLRVARFGAAPESVSVRLRALPGPDAKQGTERVEKVSLQGEGSATVRLTFQNAGDVEVSLPDDALLEDGQARLTASPTRPLAVSLAQGLGPLERDALERFLAASPDVARDGAAGETLLMGPRGTDAKVTVGATGKVRTFVGPFFSEKGHPLLDDVQLAGVRWSAGENPPGHPLITAGDAVLVSEEDDGRLHLNVDLARSNVQRVSAWPVLLGNVVRESRRAREGFVRRQLTLGEPLQLVTLPGKRYTLTGPSGSKPVFGAGAVSLPPPAMPGRYVLERDGADGVDAAEVLALDARESDLRGRGRADVPARESGDDEARANASDRARWPLVLLLLALVGDFYVTRRVS
ncbi:BatA domain-containing protein [Myxococcus sp. CA056]|uniref:vWA domain-containing protein n=1 Tax=unclassified Myxococcus TaxID=2648731 RepID=UPI00157A64E7|nr:MULTISPECIES: BatA and WFA domain-containing protein [unclassified Myxococcus]NTX11718.1 BatA domain-containing protein [Myxococcus sp. CA056]NTX34184.1 BatA domain-containing protein [Myxococcus sp. CA033]NTX51875.1 BatA domain-containing protein [Myxococcus sp. CA039A]